MRVFRRAWLEIRRGYSCAALGIVEYQYFHVGNSEAARIRGKGVIRWRPNIDGLIKVRKAPIFTISDFNDVNRL